MSNKIQIVSTASLDKELIERLKAEGIETEVHPFINTKSLINESVKRRVAELERLSPVIVFTSANAVRAVGELLTKKPDWKIYCIAGATWQAVKQYFNKENVIGVADNATLLAAKMISNAEAGIVFFCGNQRLDIIPQMLADSQIAVEEMLVYETKLTPGKVSDTADGIMFFSSSAVKSYLSMNKPSAETICFAIGETTAQELRENLDNKIVIAGSPGKKEMVELVLNFYHENKRTNNDEAAGK